MDGTTSAPMTTRELAHDYLTEHGDIGVTALADALGVSTSTAGYHLGTWRKLQTAAPKAKAKAKAKARAKAEEEVADDAPPPDDDGLVEVNGEYLATLETLRDVVAENHRLRRIIDAD